MANQESIYRTKWNQSYTERIVKGTEGQGGSRTQIEKEHRHPKSLKSVRWSMARENQSDFLQWWVNPSECRWQVGTRSAIEKIASGAIHYEAQNQATRLEFPMLTLSFQSGIITQGSYVHVSHASEPKILPHGLANFYDFLAILDQPNSLGGGVPNYVNIFYNSATFGANGMWLQGFFTEDGVTWTDTADNPQTISNWGATFMVVQSNPALTQLRQKFRTMGIT